LRSPDSTIRASVEILRYKTFNDLIALFLRWAEQALKPIPPSSHLSAGREKQQKFGILDSPGLLASDLRESSGISGTALIYLDLDSFKAVNTNLTEALVDEIVLPPIHQLLADYADRVGYAYGEGGDEFVFLLPNASEPVAIAFAEGLRAHIERLKLKGRAAGIQFTASLGVAHASPSEDPTNLKKRANEAKNFAKANGKNTVAVWRPSKPEIPGKQVPIAPPGVLHKATQRSEPVESTEHRTMRVARVLGLEQPDTGSVLYKSGNKTHEVNLPTHEGRSKLYYLMSGETISEYWYVACDDAAHADKTLADIRVILTSVGKLLSQDAEAPVRFVIATELDLATQQSEITKKFNKMKSITKVPAEADVRLEFWDRSGLAAKELELGIRI
jgi:diguanylate cyclase (GGDEF)-like protein